MLPVTRVLFVCTGNLCRSVMAEAAFRQICERRGLTEVTIASAGLDAQNGQAPAVHTCEVLREFGIEMAADARARRLDLPMIQDAMLLVGMTRRHARIIGEMDVSARRRTRTIFSYIRSDRDLVDPYMGTLLMYRNCLKTLYPLLECLADQFVVRQPPTAPIIIRTDTP